MSVQISNKTLFYECVSKDVLWFGYALDAWLPMDGVLVRDWILKALD